MHMQLVTVENDGKCTCNLLPERKPRNSCDSSQVKKSRLNIMVPFPILKYKVKEVQSPEGEGSSGLQWKIVSFWATIFFRAIGASL
jgi:hypothetical protein